MINPFLKPYCSMTALDSIIVTLCAIPFAFLFVWIMKKLDK